MRFGAALVVCGGLLLTVAGCDQTDRVFFKQGIGTELNNGDIVASAEAEDEYLGGVCHQAGLQMVAGGCDDSSPKSWQLFVQAGMNDINRRCDAYLLWIDYVRRGRDPTLRVISDAATYSALIMDRAGVSAAPIAIAGAAFGFARNTFENVTSRLILEVNHSAVQSVVLSAQKRFREELLGSFDKKIPPVVIASRPAAIYALRSYLRLCMPVTIEAEINNTVVTFARGGPEALADQEPLVSGRNVSVIATRADQKVFEPKRQFNPASSEVAQFFEEKLSQAEAAKTLNGLCLDKNTKTGLTRQELITSLVKIFEQSRDSDIKPVVDGKISKRERPFIAKQTDCGEARNFYERTAYANTVAAGVNSAEAIAGLIRNRLSRSPDSEPIPDKPTLTSLRKKISAARAALKLEDVPAGMNDQMTRDLSDALAALPAK